MTLRSFIIEEGRKGGPRVMIDRWGKEEEVTVSACDPCDTQEKGREWKYEPSNALSAAPEIVLFLLSLPLERKKKKGGGGEKSPHSTRRQDGGKGEGSTTSGFFTSLRRKREREEKGGGGEESEVRGLLTFHMQRKNPGGK